MVISNAKIYIDGHFTHGSLHFEDKITKIGKSDDAGDIDALGMYLIPGLIDIHTHGAMNEDASDGNTKGLEKMSEYYAKEGVTSFCPTTMTLPEDELTKAMHAIKAFKRPKNGAKIAGINLEGPFLSKEKCGAQNPDYLRNPDIAMFKRLNNESGNMIKLVTIAPENEGSIDFIKEISKTVSVSLGHTNADYDTAIKAYEKGACHATHLCNAMSLMLAREPGTVGAAIEKASSAELICDGHHIHPATVKAMFKLFGKRLCLISDSLRCAGMPDGDYILGGQDITKRDGAAYLKGQNMLAGSVIHLMEGLRRATFFGIPLEDAIYAVTKAPAKAIKMDDKIGSIEVGKDADFVILDQNLDIKAVYINGKKI